MSSGFTEQEFGPAPSGPEPQKKANGRDTDAWPALAASAYHGLAGEVVATILPHTESDPVALLLQYLAYFGNAIGHGPYYQINQDRHYGNLYVLLAGASAKARKGLSAGLIRHIYVAADPAWARECITGGISSGEGIMHAIRDPIYTMRKGELELADPGVDDKRLLLDEREFYQALAVMKREGNIVSRIVRDGWDSPLVLRTLTKNTQTRVTNPHITIVGHITIEELQQTLDHTSMANGYANRFLFACVRRSKQLPLGGDAVEEAGLGAKTQRAVELARAIDRVAMTGSAVALWCEVYPSLSEERPGLLAAITARAEGQTMRLALIYALLDGAHEIDRPHLEAALAVWAFCAASARHIFGDLTGDRAADTILRALHTAGAAGRTRSELHGLFSNHRSAGDIGRALELLLKAGKARFTTTPPQGRWGQPRETWYAN
jgi:hypothetical protein